MANLYEILEVSEKASKEVIDKAYKVLAKKYHPDLQKEEDKKSAEIKMKEVNEAYEVLSDDEKRKEYDLKLEEERRQEEYEKAQSLNNQNQSYNDYNENNQNIAKNEYVQDYKKVIKNQKQNAKILQNEMKRAYADAYNDYLRSLGYKIKEPWTFKRLMKLIKIICIISIIIAIIWFFPPTHKLLLDMYNNNEILKTIINILAKIIIGIWNGIMIFIKNIFKIQ